MGKNSIHYSNVVDFLNEKFMNWESGTHYYPFSFEDNSMSQKICLFGAITLWDSDEGFPAFDKWPEGENFEQALIDLCQIEYCEIIENLYGAYALAINPNMAEKVYADVEQFQNEDIIITYYRREDQFVNESPKGARIYYTDSKLYVSCHKHNNRFKNKAAAIKEIKQKLKKENF